MRVLMAVPERRLLGGINATAPPLVEGLRNENLEIVEQVYGARTAAPTVLERLYSFVLSIYGLRQLTRDAHFDVIHIHSAFDLKALFRDFLTLLFFGGHKQRSLLLEFHGSDEKLIRTGNPFLKAITKFIIHRADGLALLSRDEVESFRLIGASQDKLFAVPNILDKQIYKPSAGLRRKLGIGDKIPLLLFAGRFVPSKGIVYIIRACEILKRRGVTFLLICVGEGVERTRLEEEVSRLGLTDQVRFLGKIPEAEMPLYYANSTLLVFPSETEGFSMTVFQSVAAGLPIITTQIRATKDYLNEPDNCLWVNARDTEDIAFKIRYLLDQAELMRKMSENNRCLADKFSQGQVSRQFMTIYDELKRRKQNSFR